MGDTVYILYAHKNGVPKAYTIFHKFECWFRCFYIVLQGMDRSVLILQETEAAGVTITLGSVTLLLQ